MTLRTCRTQIKKKWGSICLQRKHIDPEPDDDDDEIEVVGTKEGAAAVAGSTFLGHDLQQSQREFEEAEKSGNIISLIDDDEPDSNNSTAKVKLVKEKLQKKLKSSVADSRTTVKMMTMTTAILLQPRQPN